MDNLGVKKNYFSTTNNKFLFGILLNLLFVGIEILYGIKVNSVALIADATHNARDVFGLLISWFGYWIANKKAPYKFTYGFKNAAIIAAFVNSIFLFIAVGGITWEAFGRLAHQEATSSYTIIFVASIGVIINALTAALFFNDRHHDINMKAVFLDMTLDAAVSFGVIIGGILILWKKIGWIDPAIGLIIAAIILINSWRLFKESLDLMLLAVPTSIDLDKLKILILHQNGLIDYHDLHIWPLSTTDIALSAHLIVRQDSFSDSFLKNFEKNIKMNFPISHVTLQLELQNSREYCETNC